MTFSDFQAYVNRRESRISVAYTDGDLAAIFSEHASRKQRTLSRDLVDKACRTLADARGRADLPHEIRRAADPGARTLHRLASGRSPLWWDSTRARPGHFSGSWPALQKGNCTHPSPAGHFSRLPRSRLPPLGWRR